jgi:hypothetical protein
MMGMSGNMANKAKQAALQLKQLPSEEIMKRLALLATAKGKRLETNQSIWSIASIQMTRKSRCMKYTHNNKQYLDLQLSGYFRDDDQKSQSKSDANLSKEVTSARLWVLRSSRQRGCTLS